MLARADFLIATASANSKVEALYLAPLGGRLYLYFQMDIWIAKS
jgi:hypothetical protein